VAGEAIFPMQSFFRRISDVTDKPEAHPVAQRGEQFVIRSRAASPVRRIG
jgi:hypothetical protein